jgi:phosphonate transport system permease protein
VSLVGRVARPPRPSRLRRDLLLLAVAIVFVWATVGLGFKLDRLAELPGSLAELLGDMLLPPAWDYIGTAMDQMRFSIQIAWVGTLIGAILSLPLGFFGARNVSSGLVSNVMRQVLNAIRAFPEIILAIAIMIPIAGLGPVAGALAIGLHSVGTLGKLTAEVIEGIDSGPVEAARAAGARSLQIQRWGVLPQVLPEIVAFWLYRFEINIRAAAVLGVVGAGGIGFSLQQTIAFHRYELTGTLVIVIVVATIAVDTVSGWVRRRIIEGAGAKRIHDEAVEEPSLAAMGAGKIDTDID